MYVYDHILLETKALHKPLTEFENDTTITSVTVTNTLARNGSRELNVQEEI
jgi:hypothetical protein